ncbi:mannosyltransferase [Roridomyces roridus]|uniref:Alpha-1,3/1,6-mannosyltransferase ALG2 n=1 Tax=Roridomyces roridus TaxID=1738132 RepID=A0AAD7BVU4_9AGAR|nr:mannosyltransferase [Roridomyces roridus]
MPLRVAFVHPDLGIGGAERLVVDAAVGVQALGHSLVIYTSHHDPNHCFDETRNGQLAVRHVVPPFPRSIKGKFHILFAHARQLHLTLHLLSPWAPKYDVYFVDQLSTCIPFLRLIGRTPVVFYCHFPDKLLASGAVALEKKRVGLLKRLYRLPMDWLEEVTTRQADVILSNSNFTAKVFRDYFPSIGRTPRTVYPGINLATYDTPVDLSDPDIVAVVSAIPTLLSLNRFEGKKNAALAIQAFAKLRKRVAELPKMRLVLAGGYDPRLEDNMQTFFALIDLVRSNSLTFNVIKSAASSVRIPDLNTDSTSPDVLFLLNFSTEQRTALLTAPSTRALLYTPANEHFGIVPVEAMVCGLPVLACDSGGPTESTIVVPEERTGWLCKPDPDLWAEALVEIVHMSSEERAALSQRAKDRARNVFGMEAMALRLEEALQEAVAMEAPGGALWLLVVMLFGFLIAYFISSWAM